MTAEMSAHYDHDTDQWVLRDLDLGSEFRSDDLMGVLEVAAASDVRYFYPDGEGRLRGYIVPRRNEAPR